MKYDKNNHKKKQTTNELNFFIAIQFINYNNQPNHELQKFLGAIIF